MPISLKKTKNSVRFFAKSFPLERRKFFRRYEERLNRDNVSLIFKQLLQHIIILFPDLSVLQKALALEAMTNLCALAKDEPILVPDLPKTLAQLPASILNALRNKEGRGPLGNCFDFIGGCFASKRTKKSEARRFAVYLRLIEFDSPLECSTDAQMDETEALRQPTRFKFASPDDDDIYARLMKGTFENIDTIAGNLWHDMRGINDRLPIYADPNCR